MVADKPTVIDGFTSVQAVRRAKVATRAPRTRPSPKSLPGVKPRPGEESDGGTPAATRIGHTAIPARHDIVCYECGYAFRLQGKITRALCPKCKQDLCFEDIVIEGNWRRNIRTVGAVDVKSGAVVQNADITTNRLVLAGDIETSSVRSCQVLELMEGARFDLKKIETQDICIHEAGRFALSRKIACRNLDVRGTLRAKVNLEGRLTVAPGGSFFGEFRGTSLRVEEGGCLSAQIFLGPKESAGRVKKRAPGENRTLTNPKEEVRHGT